MIQPRTALVALLACAPPAIAWAGDQSAVNVSVTDTLVSEVHTDNRNGDPDDDNYGIIFNRLNLTGNAGDLTGTLRLDTTKFIDAPTDEYEDDLRLERITLQYRFGDWQITGGDFFRQLGRGIVLSIRKQNEAGVDLSIRGGEISFEGEAHRVSLFGGEVNPTNLDPVSQKFVEDPRDALAGGHYEYSGLDFMQVGLHGLATIPKESLLPEETDYTLSGGLFAEFPDVTDWLSLYLEADVQQRVLGGSENLGKAFYAVADLTLGDFVVLLEGMWLDAFEQKGSRNSALKNRFDYNQPPTLERVDQEVLNSRDVLGGRLRIERLIESVDLLLYVNGLYRITDIGTGAELWQFHGYGGFEQVFDRGASRLHLSAGYRTEVGDGDLDPDVFSPDFDSPVKTMIHAELDYLHSLGGGASLHVVSSNEFRGLADADYARGSTIFGVELAGVGGVSLEFGYDTQDPSPDVRKYFLAGILSLEVVEGLTLRGIGGTQRGGIKCIAGVCRDYPEFAGGRLEIIARL